MSCIDGYANVSDICFKICPIEECPGNDCYIDGDKYECSSCSNLNKEKNTGCRECINYFSI